MVTRKVTYRPLISWFCYKRFLSVDNKTGVIGTLLPTPLEKNEGNLYQIYNSISRCDVMLNDQLVASAVADHKTDARDESQGITSISVFYGDNS